MEHISISMWSLALLVGVALAFDFMNGFHDGANSISTIVATGALTPRQAVLFAAAFNFIALWVFQLKVAATIGKGTVDPQFVDHFVIFGALMGALAWNIITWYYGIPSSSSHALVGGLVGATVVKAGGLAPIVWGGFGKILLFIVLSPLVGFFIGGILMVLVAWIFRNQSPYQASGWFRYGQLFAAGAYSLGLATLGGIPVSTTHTITGAIVGVGTAQDVKAVRWGLTFNLVVAWVLTIPASGLIAAAFWYVGLSFL